MTSSSRTKFRADSAAPSADDRTVNMARRVLAAAATLFDDEAITCAELHVLYQLFPAGGLSEEELAGCTGLSPALIKDILWSLLSQDLVADIRGSIELTDQGLQAIGQLNRVWGGFETEVARPE